MTFIYELDLDILLINLHAKIHVRMSVCLARRVVTHRHTKNVKTIKHVADVGDIIMTPSLLC